MLHTVRLQGKNVLNSAGIEHFIIDAAWLFCFAQYTIWGSSLEAAVFGQNMLSFVANWMAV